MTLFKKITWVYFLLMLSPLNAMNFKQPRQFTHYDGLSQENLNKALLENIYNWDEVGVRECIKRNADVNALINDDCGVATQNTPLHASAALGPIRIMQLLVDAGVNINGTLYGNTPLHSTISFGMDLSVTFLTEHGANLTILDRNNNTPLQLAQKKLKEFPNSDAHKEIVETIIKHLDMQHRNKLVAVLRNKPKSHDIFFTFSDRKRSLNTITDKKTKKRK